MSSQSPENSPQYAVGSPIEAASPSYTTSLEDQFSHVAIDSVYKFQEENGRTYHGYRPGTYHFPNDSTETDRLDYQHNLLKSLFHNKLHYAPLFSPQNILDIGTGTGSWAIEMGDAYPSATIQGTDLSPIQPTSVPENVQFFIDDANEEDWAVPAAHFDYIHTRYLYGCFASFKDIIQRGFYYTKPGGYMESQEIMSTPYCDDKTMPKNWPFLEWTQYNERAAKEAGRPVRMAHKLKKWYEEAGFVDVQEKVIKLPMNPWPRDKKLKELGRMSEKNILAGLSAFSLAHFSRVFGWSKTEIEVYLVNIRKSISDRNVHAYHNVHVVWGKKPLDKKKKK